MTISLFFILPVIILLIIYAIIAKSLILKRKSMVKICPNKSEVNYKARKQVVLMLGAVVVSFFMCLVPFRVLTLWIIFSPPENINQLGAVKYYSILYFCRIMLYLNSAINPILYNLMSSKFRRGFMRICCFNFKRKRTMLKHTNTTTTTTTSSLILRQSFRKSTRSAISLDDLRKRHDVCIEMDKGLVKWYGFNLIRQLSTPLLVVDNDSSSDMKDSL